jgi:DNA-binding PadR family transcriptional regulator
VNTVGPKVWLTPGSISVAVDGLVKKGLVSRKDRAEDRRVRQVELTAKGRALITLGFREHAAAMETARGVLSKKERLTLLRLLKKLGKHAAETRGIVARGDAASRGEQPGDVEAWLEDLTDSLAGHDVEVEGRVVTSITGYSLCDMIEGLEADLLVVKAEPDGPLPKHMDWLYQVIPTRLLLVRGS